MSKKNITRVSKKVRAKKSRHLIELFKSRVKNPEIVFLSLIIPFGFIMTFLMPIGSIPDEEVHFYRTFQVSEGGMMSTNKASETGGDIPQRIVTDIQESLTVFWNKQTFPRQNIFTKISGNRVDFNKRLFMPFPTSAVYPPVTYVPQAIGINFARIIYPTTGFMVLMAKLCNLALFIVLVWWAIRIAIYQRWVYVTLALFPIVVQQATSLSTDVMTIGGLFVFIATLHNIFLERKPLTSKVIWQLVISTLLIILSRPTNVVVLLPILFIPNTVTKGWSNKIKLIMLLGFGSLVISIGWYLLMKVNGYNLDIRNEANVDMVGQLRFTITHPITFVKTLIKAYIINVSKSKEGMTYMSDFIISGSHSYFSWFFYKLPIWSLFVGYITLVITFLQANSGRLAKKLINRQLFLKVGLIFVLTFILSIVSIATIVYLTWTPVGSDIVLGIQGRYIIGFIPLLTPIAMYLQKYIKVIISNKALGSLVFFGSLVNLLVMVLMTYKWFY